MVLRIRTTKEGVIGLYRDMSFRHYPSKQSIFSIQSTIPLLLVDIHIRVYYTGSFSNQTAAKTHQNWGFSSYHYPITIDWDSVEKIQKILCYNSMRIRKFGTFSFYSPRAVRWGIFLPLWYLPRHGFLYGKDTLQLTLPSSCPHSSVQIPKKNLK